MSVWDEIWNDTKRPPIHTVDEVKAAVNAGVEAASKEREAVSALSDGLKQDGPSLEGCVASMDVGAGQQSVANIQVQEPEFEVSEELDRSDGLDVGF